MTDETGQERRNMIMSNRIEVNPEVLLGKPVIAGTRTPVYLILKQLLGRDQPSPAASNTLLTSAGSIQNPLALSSSNFSRMLARCPSCFARRRMPRVPITEMPSSLALKPACFSWFQGERPLKGAPFQGIMWIYRNHSTRKEHISGEEKIPKSLGQKKPKFGKTSRAQALYGSNRTNV